MLTAVTKFLSSEKVGLKRFFGSFWVRIKPWLSCFRSLPSNPTFAVTNWRKNRSCKHWLPWSKPNCLQSSGNRVIFRRGGFCMCYLIILCHKAGNTLLFCNKPGLFCCAAAAVRQQQQQHELPRNQCMNLQVLAKCFTFYLMHEMFFCHWFFR